MVWVDLELLYDFAESLGNKCLSTFLGSHLQVLLLIMELSCTILICTLYGGQTTQFTMLRQIKIARSMIENFACLFYIKKPKKQAV